MKNSQYSPQTKKRKTKEYNCNHSPRNDNTHIGLENHVDGLETTVTRT